MENEKYKIIMWIGIIFLTSLLIVSTAISNYHYNKMEDERNQAIHNMDVLNMLLENEIETNKEYEDYIFDNPPIEYYELYKAFHDYDNVTIQRLLEQLIIIVEPMIIFQGELLPEIPTRP